LKICKGKYPLRHAAVFTVCFAAEKDRASLTSADHLVSCYVDQVFVLGVQFGAAQFAALYDRALPYESSQNGEGSLGIGNFRLPIADFGIIVSGMV